MAGTFIISLDCEGKWGMADKIGPQHDVITHSSLVDTYRRLVSLFRSYDMKVTFAFVGAFTLTDHERRENPELFVDHQYRGANWLLKYREAEASGNLDGWFCPEALDMAKQEGHEIGSHGFLHVPFDDDKMPVEALSNDLAAAVTLAKRKRVSLETFVYPRNKVANTQLLDRHGLCAYRGELVANRSPVAALQEFSIFASAQRHGEMDGATYQIPAGYFFNWRFGARRHVPRQVTVQRWRSILTSAARHAQVAHLWLHPHNIITGPETLDVLGQVVAMAARMRDAGRIQVMTMADYSRAMAPAGFGIAPVECKQPA